MTKDVVIMNSVFGAEWYWGNPQTSTEYEIFLFGMKFEFYLFGLLNKAISNSDFIASKGKWDMN
jgi:hypothetical protein